MEDFCVMTDYVQDGFGDGGLALAVIDYDMTENFSLSYFWLFLSSFLQNVCRCRTILLTLQLVF